MKKKIIVTLIVLFILIQFFRPARNTANAKSPADIANAYAIPENVSTILQKACLDCHSNNTIYPWYANVQPVAWWLDDHIQEGKGELNFSVFGSYTPARQYHKLEEIKEVVDKNQMPLSSYTLIHTDAKLKIAEKQALISWSEDVCNQMKAKYPADSLIMKRGSKSPAP